MVGGQIISYLHVEHLHSLLADLVPHRAIDFLFLNIERRRSTAFLEDDAHLLLRPLLRDSSSGLPSLADRLFDSALVLLRGCFLLRLLGGVRGRRVPAPQGDARLGGGVAGLLSRGGSLLAVSAGCGRLSGVTHRSRVQRRREVSEAH